MICGVAIARLITVLLQPLRHVRRMAETLIAILASQTGWADDQH